MLDVSSLAWLPDWIDEQVVHHGRLVYEHIRFPSSISINWTRASNTPWLIHWQFARWEIWNELRLICPVVNCGNGRISNDTLIIAEKQLRYMKDRDHQTEIPRQKILCFEFSALSRTFLYNVSPKKVGPSLTIWETAFTFDATPPNGGGIRHRWCRDRQFTTAIPVVGRLFAHFIL